MIYAAESVTYMMSEGASLVGGFPLERKRRTAQMTRTCKTCDAGRYARCVTTKGRVLKNPHKDR